MIYYAKEFGILHESDITKSINNFLAKQELQDGSNELVFDKGVYYLSSDNAVKLNLNITNTMGKNEWKSSETRNENRVGILLNGINNLIIDFADSVLIIDGQMTNIALLECSDITIKNVVLRTLNPDMHELTVIKRGINYIDYVVDEESKYLIKNSKAYFIGKDYETDFYDGRVTAYWIAMIPSNNSDTVSRVRHPLLGATKIKEIAANTLRVSYILAPRHKVGNKYYLFENRRRYQGVFASHCSDIKIDNFEQNFNYGLAFVAQETKNITVTNCKFRPDPNSKRLMTSVADFMQVCMCRGNVDVRNNIFEGAGDDALNVHGIHFKVTEVNDKKIQAKFSHRQTYGFCPFCEGDIIRFIDTSTLLETCDRFVVDNAKLIDEYTIELTSKTRINAKTGTVIENLSACPNLLYEGNSIKRIVSRGILITTSGKVIVKNNKFIDTSMHSILISDDAKSWYESGNVTDVLIENNEFRRCIGYSVQIKPENSIHKAAVHNNITITGNTIDSLGEGGFYIKSADDVVLSNNSIVGKANPTYVKNSKVTIE